ncbi:unnamed protein product [Vitrella brassicaformis CCMP3155]|uniref:Uncharacterized protein n=1 Tax=Vitrella brassicaformis (strain CCMP3155) TaxID=1169540 RepID=A0A0G4FZL9_VITBC|nr:unnamed protein product [Vitrella brassicaformis CCMP3155]|eukprot:CEM20978.1 unnamed protein product [Vitrella brassicaformis CCMP3155]
MVLRVSEALTVFPDDRTESFKDSRATFYRAEDREVNIPNDGEKQLPKAPEGDNNSHVLSKDVAGHLLTVLGYTDKKDAALIKELAKKVINSKENIVQKPRSENHPGDTNKDNAIIDAIHGDGVMYIKDGVRARGQEVLNMLNQHVEEKAPLLTEKAAQALRDVRDVYEEKFKQRGHYDKETGTVETIASETYHASPSTEMSKNGQPVFIGDKGGRFYINGKGHRQYVNKEDTVPRTFSNEPPKNTPAAEKADTTAFDKKPAPPQETLEERGHYDGKTGSVKTIAGATYSASPSTLKAKNGQPIFVGPRGGLFYIDGKGRRQYVDEKDAIPETQTRPLRMADDAKSVPTADTVSGKGIGEGKPIGVNAKGETVFEGPKGGRYIVDASNNRHYRAEVQSNQVPSTGSTTGTGSYTNTGTVKEVGTNKKGEPVYEGPLGGIFTISQSNTRRYGAHVERYHPQPITSTASSIPAASASSGSTGVGSGTLIGHTTRGNPVYMGPQGGQYTVSAEGNRGYSANAAYTLSSEGTGGNSSGGGGGYTSGQGVGSGTLSGYTSGGNAVFTGPRGGTYTVSASGNRRYGAKAV